MGDTPTFAGLRSFLQLKMVPVHDKGPMVSIAGIPFDLGTSNRPGARFGPAAIRDASLMLMDGDHPEIGLNPAQELRLSDIGDFEIANGYLTESLALIEEQAASIDGQLIAMGGDHTVTLPLLRALAKKHEKPISLVHFDAHVDTWADNFGSPVGHRTPFRFAAEEGLIDPRSSIQIGIRSPVDRSVMKYTRDELGFTVVSAEDVHMQGVLAVVSKVRDVVGDNPVYLTFDIDALDPSQAPGTGTPEVGGLFSWQALAILKRLRDINWIGMDLVEVAPVYDHAQITALCGATVIWTYLCLLAEKSVIKNDK